MQLLLLLMTASVSLMSETTDDNGMQLMSLLNGSFLESQYQRAQDSPEREEEQRDSKYGLNVFVTEFPIYGRRYHVITTLRSMPRKSFKLSIEMDTEDYLIDQQHTFPKISESPWSYTNNLSILLRKYGIRRRWLPYRQCFYIHSRATFYNLDHKYIKAIATNLEPLSLLERPKKRKLKVLMPEKPENFGSLQLYFCKNPRSPVPLSPMSHLVFHASIGMRTGLPDFDDIEWNFYDMREQYLIHDFGKTKGLFLKLVPFSADYSAYNFRDEMFMLRASTKISGVKTMARCYVKYVPPAIESEITGNERRLVDVREQVFFDGTQTKDRLYAMESFRSKQFLWNCESRDDPANKFCRKNISTKTSIRFPARSLKAGKIYIVALTVTSTMNPGHTATAVQVVKAVEKKTVSLHINCRRNCDLDVFSPDESVHLTADCYNCPHDQIVSHEWWGSEDGQEATLLSRGPFLVWRGNPEQLRVYLKVRTKDNAIGGALQTINRNDGPQRGSCEIDPKIGTEAVTEFIVDCHGFETPYPPLRFRIRIGGGVIVSMVPYLRFSIRLPTTKKVSISICDMVDRCVWQTVRLNVEPFPFPPSMSMQQRIEYVMNETAQDLQFGLFNKGFISALVATTCIQTVEQGRLVYSFMADQNLQTGAQLEQLTLLGIHIMARLSPLTYRTAHLMATVFIQLNTIFQMTVENRGWMHWDAYHSLSAMYMVYMSTFGDASKLETLSRAMCRPTNPHCVNMVMLDKLESHMELKFDSLILLRINYWMRSTWFLYKCIYYLGVLATQRHHPYDEAWSLNYSGISYQVNVTEVGPELRDTVILSTIDLIHKVQISPKLMIELRQRLNHSTVLFQVISQQNFHNIFWWYPDPLPAKTSVLIIHAYSPGSSSLSEGGHFYVSNPLVFRTNITEFNDDPAFQPWMANNSIYAQSRVDYYSLMLSDQAMLAVRVVYCTEPMLIQMRLHQKPSPRDGHCLVTPAMKGKRVWMSNGCKRSRAFVAVMKPHLRSLSDPPSGQRSGEGREDDYSAIPLNYSILLEIYECNVWENNTIDPGWNAEYCRTTFEAGYGTSVQCTCTLFGAMASRIIPISAEQHVEYIPQIELFFQFLIILFFLALLGLLIALLILDLGQITAEERRQNFMRCEVPDGQSQSVVIPENEILLIVETGGQMFAGTTSNIKMYFKSPHRNQSALQINQDPGHPRLVTNSTNRLMVPRGSIFIPTRLALGIDRNGRYPSWYCRSVTVVDLKQRAQQHFVVERWIEWGHTHFMRSRDFTFGDQRRSALHTWSTRFRNRMEEICISWFLINPMTGPWQCSVGSLTMGRFCRSCILIAKVAITITLVSVYFDVSTVESIQEEHRLYGGNYIDVSEMIMLAIVIFFIGCAVHFFFEVIVLQAMFPHS